MRRYLKVIYLSRVMKLPPIVINFKLYESSIGKNAVKLAKICEKVGGKNIVVCVSAVDLKEVSKAVKISVFCQHVDGLPLGAETGAITPELIKLSGGQGSLINHSEDRYTIDEIKAAIKRCKDVGIFSLVCAKTAVEAGQIARYNPDAISIEPPALIGGNVSVTTADPISITKTVQKVRKYNKNVLILCGAGVKTAADVRNAKHLGSAGVLLASGVACAKNPESALKELLRGLH
jgi:triosephosphate isomerase (TIM)